MLQIAELYNTFIWHVPKSVKMKTIVFSTQQPYDKIQNSKILPTAGWLIVGIDNTRN
jgi:hypothetical protein